MVSLAQGGTMTESESARLRAFPASAHHTRPDEFVLYWSDEDDRAVPFDLMKGVILLRADANPSRITGIRVSTFYQRYVRIPPDPEPPPARPNQEHDENPAKFVPYIWYDRNNDRTIIRWEAGAVERVEIEHNARLTVLRNPQSKLILGVIHHGTDKILRKMGEIPSK
jgi:hypothetical protein